ncbi:MAG TPA: asparagine synthase (glutamine-hydrolyzing) [Puia sp.]|jgi:asparagine synthase (glutamine-hydrolysing)|nr:asparagine synthase (glutamine-hydrolyzing) [Puia sp.]
MCGIAGFYLYDQCPAFNKAGILHLMGDQIAHRGPDDEQIYLSGEANIIFRRLSIVDIEGGKQPLMNEDGSIVLVVNGEIYNYKELIRTLKGEHQFKSRSDCEVLVHLYEEKGVDFLKSINGMFGLVLWDTRNHLLLLARDRLGIKPLYFSYSPSRLLFASEMKALFAFPDCPREYDWQEALNGNKKAYAGNNYQVETCFVGIHQLRGGQYLLAAAGGDPPVIKDYWSLSDVAAKGLSAGKRSPVRLIEEYRDMLADSVRLMLLGDVEMGLFLSGGIDSSAIAALAAIAVDIRTFSVLNRDTVESRDAYYSWEAAKHIGVSNHQVCISYDPDRHDALYWKQLVWQCETYECGPEQLYKYELYRYIRQNFPNLKAVLIGQGSDEFNGGYAHKYVGEPIPGLHNRWQEFENVLSGMEHAGLLSGSNHVFMGGLEPFIDRDYLAHLQGNKLPKVPWHGYLQMHAKNLQIYQLLHEDRTAMANGIENRVPFLDHRIVELILTAPAGCFADLFWDKSILRKGMGDLLSPELCNRPKVPFIFDNKGNHSGRMMAEIFSSNQEELIDYALEGNRHVRQVLNLTEIRKLWDRVCTNPCYRGIDEFRFLVNMGILSRTVGESRCGKAEVPEKITIPAPAFWNREESGDVGFQNYLKKEEGSLANGGAPPGLVLAKDLLILYDMKGAWYIFRGGELAEIIGETDDASRNWIRVLIYTQDNGRDIHRGLADLNLSYEELAKPILTSLKAKVVFRVRQARKAGLSNIGDYEKQ